MDANPPAIVIVDGDTFRIGRERVRIENIDAPELHGRCDAENALAQAAKAGLAAILGGGDVTVTRHGRDRYGRSLALVTVMGTDVGKTLIAAHLAVAWEGRRHVWCGPSGRRASAGGLIG